MDAGVPAANGQMYPGPEALDQTVLELLKAPYRGYSEARHKKNTILEHKIQEYLHGSREWDYETRIAGAA